MKLFRKCIINRKHAQLKEIGTIFYKKDFLTIEEQMDEEAIRNTPNEVYRKMVQKKVQKYAFKLLIEMKQKCNKKMSSLSYEMHEIQPYMISNRFNLREIKLLLSLRSKCFPAKINFTKLNRGNLRCSLLCDSYETQDV